MEKAVTRTRPLPWENGGNGPGSEVQVQCDQSPVLAPAEIDHTVIACAVQALLQDRGQVVSASAKKRGNPLAELDFYIWSFLCSVEHRMQEIAK